MTGAKFCGAIRVVAAFCGLLVFCGDALAKNPSALLPLPDVSSANCPIPSGFTQPVCFAVTATNTGDSYGIFGAANATGGTGVAGHSDNGVGTQGLSIYGTGVKGISSQGYGVWGSSVGSATGVYGSANTGWPGAGVYGTNAANGGTAIVGIATGGPNGAGIYGQGATTGVQGYANAYVNGMIVPVGVSGVASGSGGHAIDAICNGSCDSSAANTTNPGLAGHFSGNVQVDGTNATTGYPWALNLTKGSAAKPGGGMWEATTSDQRTKKDVRAFEPGLTEILQVRPVRYRFNGLAGTRDDGTEYVGVIAQELEKVLPFMVTSRKGKLRKDAQETVIKGVDPSAFTYALINAVKEQHELIKQQEARIAALERGRAPLMSSVLSGGGITAGIALGLFPMGLLVAVRRRNKRAA